MQPLTLNEFRALRLISVIRAPSADAALAAAHAVADGGVPVLEITFTVPEAVKVMASLSSRSDAVVGAGTVLTAAQAEAALAAGARFIVAPNCSPAVARVAKAAGVMYVPGAYTTGEILHARDQGADLVKVYPVGVAGGPRYIEIIRDPLPDIPMLAAGGTSLDNIVPFLRAGCVGVGVGAPLADAKLVAEGRTSEITDRARAFLAKIAEAGAPAVAPSRQ